MLRKNISDSHWGLVTQLALTSLALSACGGASAPAAQSYALQLDSQSAIAGFELKFNRMVFAPNTLGFETLDRSVKQLQRPTFPGSDAITLLVYLPGTALMPATLQSKPVTSIDAQASTVLAARCVDRQGNAVSCTARWVPVV
jgi:hypothetical protein